MNIIGAKIVIPLIEYAKENVKLFTGFKSRQDMLPILTRMYEAQKEMDIVFRNADFSSFDTSLSPQLMQSACEVIKTHIKTIKGKQIFQMLTD